MKYILIAIIIIITFGVCQAQSFEGKLTYKVDFELNEEKLGNLGVTKDILIDKMKKEEAFYDQITIYIKGGNYIKEDNSNKSKRLVYKANENLIYVFEKDSEYVTVMNGENLNSMNLKLANSPTLISQPDTSKVIQNDTCKLVRLRWEGLNDQYNWYSTKQIKIDAELFKNHNYEFLNEILTITDSYPMEISTTLGVFMTLTMTIDKIEELKLHDELFKIPELKKSTKKEHKSMGQLSGNKIMKIRN